MQEANLSRRQALQQDHDILKLETDHLRELYMLMHALSDAQALNAFRMIRDNPNPLAVLDFLRQQDIVLPRAVPPPDVEMRSSLLKLDEAALHASLIKVQATPWTTVVGDGILSEILSEFFAWEATALYHCFDREAILDDMKRNNLDDTQYCSPLLVNAMCAARCVSNADFDLIKTRD